MIERARELLKSKNCITHLLGGRPGYFWHGATDSACIRYAGVSVAFFIDGTFRFPGPTGRRGDSLELLAEIDNVTLGEKAQEIVKRFEKRERKKKAAKENTPPKASEGPEPEKEQGAITPQEPAGPVPLQHLSKNSQVEEVLDRHFEFRFNIITGQHEVRDKKPGAEFLPITDRIFNTIWSFLSAHYFPKTLEEGILRKVIESGYVVEFNPITEYFERLPSWDGVDHIGTLADLVTVRPGQYGDDVDSDEVFRVYLSKWIIASVATMLQHGVNHTCLILLGPQGCGKSTFLTRLGIAPELVFVGHVNPVDKDSKLMLAEKTIINLDELESSTREVWGFIKSLITLPKVSVRRPYARRAEELRRIASFCGSANDSHILGDLTGSRRWLCTEVTAIDYMAVTPDLMNKVYAQAYAAFKAGVRYWFNEEEIHSIDRRNEKFYSPNPEDEALQTMYRASIEDDEYSQYSELYFTNTEIMQRLNTEYPWIRFSQKKLGQVLQKLGFHRVPKDSLYKYRVYKIRSIQDSNTADM